MSYKIMGGVYHMIIFLKLFKHSDLVITKGRVNKYDHSR